MLYIDHTSAAQHGGFSITTTERCIKATTAFSRFRFELAPTAEATHLVSEDARYTERLSDAAKVQELLDREEAGLIEAGVLKPADAAELRAFVKRHELLGALRSLAHADEKMDAATVHRWQTAGSPLPAALLDMAAKCVELHERIATLRSQSAAQSSAIATVFSDQARLRQNIESLEKVRLLLAPPPRGLAPPAFLRAAAACRASPLLCSRAQAELTRAVGAFPPLARPQVGKCDLLTRYLEDLNKGEDDILFRRGQIAALAESEADLRTGLRQLRLDIDAHVSRLRAEIDFRA